MNTLLVVDGSHYIKNAIKFDDAHTLIQQIEKDDTYIELSKEIKDNGMTIKFSVDYHSRNVSCYFGYLMLENKHLYTSETCSLAIRDKANDVFKSIEPKINNVLIKHGFNFVRSGIILNNLD